MGWLSLLVLLVPVAADHDLRETVRCSEIAFSNAAENRDKAAFKAMIDPDARFVTNRVRRGPEEIGEGWSGFLEPGGATIRWRPAVVEVTQDGSLALSRGPYRAIRVDESGTQESWGHFISTWRRKGDRWYVLFDTGGDQGMTPTEEERTLLDAPHGCDW